MADRTVVARLVLDVAGYTPAAVEASKSTTALATAQKEAEASAKAAGIAQRDAGFAARDAAAQASAAAAAQSAAYKDAAAAAQESSAAQVAVAKASTEAERVEAEAAAQAAAERSAAAKEALAQATAEADATAKNAAAAKAGSLEAAKCAAAQRDIAAAAKASADAESSAAKQSAAAAAERTKAYKDSGAAMTTMALGGAAAIGLMVKSAGDFQSSTQHLVTDAGESQDKLAMVQAGILKTATATGTSATQLVDAMYHIESAGFHGQAGLNMLTVAAEGAKVGAADLGTVAKTLTGTMNSYSDAGYSSVQMMNMLIATTAAGDMKMNDLAGSLGNVTPQAAAAKISYAEVGGAIATMTSQNMTADRATQDLANTIGNLQKPSQVAITQMQQLGLDSNDVSENLGKRGLTGTLELLTTAVLDHTQNGQVFIDTLKNSKNAAADADTMLKLLPASIQGISKELLNGSISAAEYNKGISGLDAPQQHMAKQFEQLVKSSGSFNDLLKRGGPAAETYNAAMSNLLGGTTGLNTALLLTGGRMQTFKDNATAIQDAANKGGAEVDNWSKIQGTFNQKVDVAKASLGAMGIAIGTTALPMVSDLAKWVTGIITPITEWVDKNQGLTEGILGSAAAVAGLVLAIKAISKTQDLLTKAFEGINTAITSFSRNAETAAVKSEALGAANTTAAAETEAAAVSTGSWATKLGGALPIIGAMAVGAVALGNGLNKVIDGTAKAGASVDQLTTSLLNGDKTASTYGLSAEQAQKAIEGLGGKANAAISPTAALGVELARTSQMVGNGAGPVKEYDGALAALVSGGHADQAAALMAQIASATDKQGKALINTQKDFPQYWAALDKSKASQALAKDATTDATGALKANASALDANSKATDDAAKAASVFEVSVQNAVTAMNDAKTKASSLKDAMDALNGVHIAASKAAVDVQQKIADLSKALHDNGKTLDITTEAGRKNVTAIDDMATAALAHAQAVAEESGSVDAGNKALDASRAQFDAVLKAAGLSKQQIDDFNKSLLSTPKLDPIRVTADTSPAAASLQALADRFGYIQVHAVGSSSGGRAAFATGGLIVGPGTPTSDSVPISASTGEYMLNAAAVQRIGVDNLNRWNFGTGSTSVVKPSIPMTSLPSASAVGSATGSAALHIENYFENGAPPQQVAAELGWLAKARGSSW